MQEFAVTVSSGKAKINNILYLYPESLITLKTDRMKIIRNILTVLVILFALLIIVAFFLPSKKHIEASVLIKAPDSIVYNQVDNFINWENWSPWAVRDSQMVSERLAIPHSETNDPGI